MLYGDAGTDFLFAGYFDARESMYGGAGADTFAVLVRADGQLEDYIRDLGSSDRKQLIHMDPPPAALIASRSSTSDRTPSKVWADSLETALGDLYRLGEGSLKRCKSVFMPADDLA